ncbi:restriction endonuclease subunit S [Streptococcus sp. ST14]|uniref:restriction endonuclease subunit S n=1 Tax=Streptococcus sp. ST14 TaxID=3378284 RepID=UPI0038D4F71B
MKKVKLGEVCEILSGYAFKSSQFNDKKIGLPLIRIRDVERGFSDTYFEGDFPEEYLIHRGDLLITMDGSFIMKKWEGDLALLNQRVCKLRITDENVDEGYLSWIIPKFLKEIEDKTPFVTVKHLSVAKIKNISFFLPDIQEQKIISKKLDTIRQIYNFRKKQSEKYNELVKSRFNEMFGDDSNFDIDRLNNSIKEMFIGPFGSSLKNEYFVQKEKSYCMVYEQKHAIKKTMNLETRYVDEKKYKELKRFSIYGGDIIVSCRGTIGEIFQVPNDAPLGIMHPSIMKIRLDNSKYIPVFFTFMLSEYMKVQKNNSQGSGVKMAITASELGKIEFPLPPLSLQNEFADFVAQVDKSQLAIQKSLEELETLKKSLMQEYFG